MGIQARLTLFTSGLVIVLSTLLGGALLQQSFQSSVSEVISDISKVATGVRINESDKVTTALSLVQEVRTPISIFLVDPTGSLTPVIEEPLITLPQSLLSGSSRRNGIHQMGQSIYGQIPLEAESKLLLLASIKDASDRRKGEIVLLLIGVICIVLVSLLALRIVISRDVRRERRSIEEAERAHFQAKQRAALLEFAGDASHELRTPLTVIKGYLELLKRGDKLEDPNLAIEKMLKETKRMEETLNQLLDLISTESVPDSASESLDLSSIVLEIVRLFSPLFEKRSVSLKVDPGVRVIAERDSITRILNNILINIHRHTNQQDPIEIVLSQDSNWASLEVHDGGPGIPDLGDGAEARPFKRFDPSRSRSTGGSGLGLSIIESSVRGLNGKLELARSHLGGLRVRVLIPTRRNES